MRLASKKIIALVLTALLLAGFLWSAEETQHKRVLTHADAAIILAKYFGYFDRYVDKNADLQECITFLNKTGVYFGLREVVSRSEFTESDCARAMGQIDLILSGEAEFVHGKAKLPKGIASWEDFCSMHGIRYAEGHRAMLKLLLVEKVRKD